MIGVITILTFVNIEPKQCMQGEMGTALPICCTQISFIHAFHHSRKGMVAQTSNLLQVFQLRSCSTKLPSHRPAVPSLSGNEVPSLSGNASVTLTSSYNREWDRALRRRFTSEKDNLEGCEDLALLQALD